MPPEIVASDQTATDVASDAVVVGWFSDGPSGAAAAVDSALDGKLREYLDAVNFQGKTGSVEVVPTYGRIASTVVAIVGLGDRKEVSAGTVRRAAGVAIRRLGEHATVASTLHALDEISAPAEVAEGFLLGDYRFVVHKSEPRPSKVREILLLGGDVDAAQIGIATAQATILARDLTNEPSNVLTPDVLARRAREVADIAGLECTIWDEDRLEREGFGGILGVARGSDRPPRFIELRYSPTSPTERLALVGKGVTFDSGGLSLKDARSMETMKSDMAGAAAVIATMSVLPQLNVDAEVIACVPTTENLPSGDAIKPGDVIRHYDGKTTEVNNTDAEGRLILADAIAYACTKDPDVVVDVATLTGGIMVALGLRSTGVFANDDELWAQLERAGERAGERLWRMPLYDDYRRELESEVADKKNSGTRYGSAIVGAIFLKDHVKKDVRWAHLDIAAADWADKPHDEGPKGGTGAATRTLIAWLRERGS